MIELRPLKLRAANKHILAVHRHHKSTRFARIVVGAYVGGELDGAAIVGDPKASALMKIQTCLEVTRCATTGQHKNVASRLLGACWRAAEAIGCRRLVSYVRFDERGTSYRAAGFHRVADVPADEKLHGSRALRWLPGLGVEHTTEQVDRVRWEIGPDCACESYVKARRRSSGGR